MTKWNQSVEAFSLIAIAALCVLVTSVLAMNMAP